MDVFKRYDFTPKFLAIEMSLFRIKKNSEGLLHITSYSKFLKRVWSVYKVLEKRTENQKKETHGKA